MALKLLKQGYICNDTLSKIQNVKQKAEKLQREKKSLQKENRVETNQKKRLKNTIRIKEIQIEIKACNRELEKSIWEVSESPPPFDMKMCKRPCRIVFLPPPAKSQKKGRIVILPKPTEVWWIYAHLESFWDKVIEEKQDSEPCLLEAKNLSVSKYPPKHFDAEMSDYMYMKHYEKANALPALLICLSPLQILLPDFIN